MSVIGDIVSVVRIARMTRKLGGHMSKTKIAGIIGALAMLVPVILPLIGLANAVQPVQDILLAIATALGVTGLRDAIGKIGK